MICMWAAAWVTQAGDFFHLMFLFLIVLRLNVVVCLILFVSNVFGYKLYKCLFVCLFV